MGREIANNRSDIDLIVLDLTMPEYDAIEFLADLRRDGIFVPVVLMSGGSACLLHVVRNLALAQGFTVLDTFAKPFQSKRLIDALAKAIPLKG